MEILYLFQMQLSQVTILKMVRRISSAIEEQRLDGKRLMLWVARGAVSKAVGQKRCNIVALSEKYRVNIVKILEKTELFGYNVIIEEC